MFFTANATEICASSLLQLRPGQPMRLYANLNHMHLIDPATDLVLDAALQHG